MFKSCNCLETCGRPYALFLDFRACDLPITMSWEYSQNARLSLSNQVLAMFNIRISYLYKSLQLRLVQQSLRGHP